MVHTLGRRMTPVLAALAVLVFTGCESTTGLDLQPGDFEIDISGDVAASVTGIATQGTGMDGADDVWVVNLFAVGDLNVYAFLVRYGTRPGAGDYELVDVSTVDTFVEGDWWAWVTVLEGEVPAFVGYATAGTVVITSSSADQVEGTFSFEALGYDPDLPEAELSATVTGSFNAEEGSIFLPD